MSNLAFDVAYYDADEERKMRAHSPPAALSSLICNGLTVSDDDFWTYALFSEQRSHEDGYRNFAQLREKLALYRTAIDDQIGIDGKWLHAKLTQPHNHYTEMVGVGGALSLASAAHGLHEADWQRIDSSAVKTLDFHLASDGTRFVQVEAKGTCVPDPSAKGSQSAFVARIHAKKTQQRTAGAPGIYYGTITAFGRGHGHPPVIRIVDPPADEMSMDPRRYRLIARLTFFRNLLLPVYARSPILVALSNRLQALRTLREWATWDGIPLVNAAGHDMTPVLSAPASKSATTDGDVFGDVTAIGPGTYGFYGTSIDVLRMLCRQSFTEVLSFKMPSSSEWTRRRRFKAMLKKHETPEEWIAAGHARLDRATGRYTAPMEGEILRASSGRAFGVVKPAW